MKVEHVNGATLARSAGWADLVGIAGDTGGQVWLVYTAHEFDPSRGDWLDHDDLDPDAVLVVSVECVVRAAVARTA